MTFEEQVNEVLEWIKGAPVNAQKKFKETPENDLIGFHHTIGTQIRNNLKLWEVPWTPKLVNGVDCSEDHPDAISARIIKDVWDKMQTMKTQSTLKESHHPIQPLYLDSAGVLRFKENRIVRHLLDVATAHHICDMNKLACMDFDKEERQQFAQLIGYSLSGYGELRSYVTDKAYNTAFAMYELDTNEKDARIAYLENELENLRSALKEPMATLFGVHPDDLNGNDE